MSKKIVSIITCAALLCTMLLSAIVPASAEAKEYNIDFSKYVMTETNAAGGKAASRNNAGTFSIEDDETAQGGKVLKYVRNTASSTAPAHFMFMLNEVGYSSDGSQNIKLKAGEQYTFEIRYKTENIPENKSFQFRIYTTSNNEMGSQNNSTSTIVTVHKNSTVDWITDTVTVTAPNPTGILQGCLAVHNSMTDNQGTYIQNNTGWTAYIDYIKIKEVEVPKDLENEYFESSPTKINFEKYQISTTSGSNNVRSDMGAFSIKSGVEDTTDGTTFSYQRNSSTSNGSKNNPALYMFTLNETGSTTKTGNLALKSGASYMLNVRYRINDTGEGAETQRWQFRLLYAKNQGQNIPNNRCDSYTGYSPRSKVFTVVGPTDGFVSEKYVFTAPTYAEGDSISHIAAFFPTSNNGDYDTVNVAGDRTDWSWDIDYLYFTEIDNTRNDFGIYTADKNSTRTEAGDFSIVNDTDATDGKALHFVKNSDVTSENIIHSAWYLFYCNATGNNSSTGKYTLTPDQTYNVTVRYKISGGADDQKWQFRLFNTKNGFAFGNLDTDASHIMKVFQTTGNTDGYVTEKYIVKASDPGTTSSTMVAALVPVSTSDVIIPNVSKVTGYEWSIDYIYFDEVDYNYTPQHMAVDFSQWPTGGADLYGANRTFFVQEGDDDNSSEWSVVTEESGNKYIKLDHKNFEKKYIYDLGAIINPEGNSIGVTTPATYGSGPYYSIVPGEKYRISYDYKLDVATGSIPLVVATTKDYPKTNNLQADGRSVEYGVLNACDQWTNGSFVFTAKAVEGATGMHLGITFYLGGNIEREFTVCLDNIVVDRVSEVTIEDVLLVEESQHLYGAPAAVGTVGATTGFCVCDADKVDIVSSAKVGEKSYFTDPEIMSYVTEKPDFTTFDQIYYYKVNGDSNMDRKIKLDDIVHLKKNIANSDTTILDDFDCNGNVGATDLSAIRSYLLENAKEDEKLVVGVETYHPGIPGYDAEYTVNAEYLGAPADAVITCDEQAVAVNGNKITVPASFKDTTNVKSVTLTATYNGCTATYELPIVNWGETTFADEFDGTDLDTTKWGDMNEEKKMIDGNTNRLTSRNCYIEDGNLVMPVVLNPETGEYEGADINTQYTFNQQFGCYTVRMKQPDAGTNGGNNAFWLMPAYGILGQSYLFKNDEGYGCNEIDVVERSGSWGNDRWQTTLHYYNTETFKKVKESGDYKYVYTPYDPAVNDGYIEYTVAWTPDSVYIYANGQLVRVLNGFDPTETPAFVRVSNNINSVTADKPAWTGYTLPENFDKLTVYVDYVRVYAWN